MPSVAMHRSFEGSLIFDHPIVDTVQRPRHREDQTRHRSTTPVLASLSAMYGVLLLHLHSLSNVLVILRMYFEPLAINEFFHFYFTDDDSFRPANQPSYLSMRFD